MPPTTTADPQAATKAAVLAAYQASWDDFLAVAEHNPVNALDPRLGDHMAGTELNFVRESLTNLAIHNERDSGTVDTSRAKVTALNSTAAIVTDCGFDHTEIINNSSGAVISAATTGRTLTKEKLVLFQGVWKVTEGGSSGSCA